MNFNENFKDLVYKSNLKTDEYYNGKIKDVGNPYYIGFGNPNAKILIFGKEKAFSEKEEKKLKYESIGNPKEWKYYVENLITYHKEPFYLNTNYVNAFYPYQTTNKSGRTWQKYEVLINKIYDKNDFNHNDFFKDAFLSEINYKPSKTSKIKKFKDPIRIEFLKNDFYKSFKVIFLACADYLSPEQIQEIFNVNFSQDLSKPRNRIKIYKNENLLVINTRQLSFDVSDKYLDTLAGIAKENIRL
jgi:hypothetical protein